MRWSQLSNNPNDARVKAWRSESLTKVRSAKIVEDRIRHLCDLARGKDVLDIGCVAHFSEASEDPQWLHGHLARAARHCLGVDILEESVEKLKMRGYNVRVADLTVQPLTQRFEVIICGELIEHIGLPGPLFSHVAEMLAPGGVFALTTPFPWYIGWVAKNLFGRRVAVGSVDHVAWYDPCTLIELAERHRLRLRFFAGVRDVETSRTLRLAKSCLGLLTSFGLRSEVLTRSLLYEFELAAAL